MFVSVMVRATKSVESSTIVWKIYSHSLHNRKTWWWIIVFYDLFDLFCRVRTSVALSALVVSSETKKKSLTDKQLEREKSSLLCSAARKCCNILSSLGSCATVMSRFFFTLPRLLLRFLLLPFESFNYAFACLKKIVLSFFLFYFSRFSLAVVIVAAYEIHLVLN